jgi:phytanoyl-CoA hydroxylase
LTYHPSLSRFAEDPR